MICLPTRRAPSNQTTDYRLHITSANGHGQAKAEHAA
jgi:hypothetical protein